LSAETITMSWSSRTVDSAKMLRMSSSTISTFLPGSTRAEECRFFQHLPLALGQLGHAAVQEEADLVQQPLRRVGLAHRENVAKRFQASPSRMASLSP